MIDNGTRVNPIEDLLVQEIGGAQFALQKLLKKEQFEMNYSSRDKLNTTKITFNKQAFNVNKMSEIVVPSFLFHVQPVFLCEGDYRYYYVDVCKALDTSRRSDTISGKFDLVRYAKDLVDKRKFKKVFFYFSYMNTDRAREVYSQFKEIIDLMKGDSKIALIPEKVELD